MFIDTILQGWRKSKRNVCDVARHFKTILVIPNDGSFARMSVQTYQQSEKKLGYVHIAMNHFLSIHQKQISAVLWNVVQQGLKQMLGLCRKNFFANAHNVARNFGESYLRLNIEVVNFVLANVELILRNLMIVLNRVFIPQVSGYKREKELSYGTMRPVSNVDLRAHIFMSIIRNLKEMVAWRVMITSQPYAHIATG